VDVGTLLKRINRYKQAEKASLVNRKRIGWVSYIWFMTGFISSINEFSKPK
jgi:hypothetical protein